MRFAVATRVSGDSVSTPPNCRRRGRVCSRTHDVREYVFFLFYIRTMQFIRRLPDPGEFTCDRRLKWGGGHVAVVVVVDVFEFYIIRGAIIIVRGGRARLHEILVFSSETRARTLRCTSSDETKDEGVIDRAFRPNIRPRYPTYEGDQRESRNRMR